MKNKVTITGICLFVVGVICFIVRSFIPTTVKNNGILVDHFYLVGFGYLFIFIGIIVFIIGLVISHNKK